MRKPPLRVLRGNPEDTTCALWLDCCWDVYPGNATAASRQKYRDAVRRFARTHGRSTVAGFTPLQAQAWAMKRPADVRILRLAWQKAMLAGVAPFNVWDVVEVPRREREDHYPPTPAQLEAIVARARERANPDWAEWRRYECKTHLWEQFADMVIFAAYTGARLGGCANLRRRDVDLERGRVTLHEKGDKVRTAALLGPSREALARAWWHHTAPRGGGANGYVFLTAAGNPINAQWVSKRWVAVKGEFPWGFHSLRHFAASWMLERGASELDVAVQLGHTDSLGRPYPELIRRVYGHADPEDALGRLEGVIGA